MTRGGKRMGAGRKRGSNAYGEPTRPMRIPESMVPDVEKVLKLKMSDPVPLPLYASGVSAGFPLPGDDSVSDELDLNNHLIANPLATFLIRANGDSMQNAGIDDGDMLVVDRSIAARNGNIIVAAYEGALTVKRLVYKADKVYLHPENLNYDPLEVTDDLKVWGVVTSVIRKFRH